jgi:hypothetical protein
MIYTANGIPLFSLFRFPFFLYFHLAAGGVFRLLLDILDPPLTLP